MLSQTADLAGCSSEADSAAQPKKRAETFSGFEHKDKEPSGFHSYLLTHMFTVYLLTRFRSFKTIEITLIIILNSLLSVSPALCPYPHLYPSSHSLSSNPSLSLPPLSSPLCPSPLPIPFPSVHLPSSPCPLCLGKEMLPPGSLQFVLSKEGMQCFQGGRSAVRFAKPVRCKWIWDARFTISYISIHL